MKSCCPILLSIVALSFANVASAQETTELASIDSSGGQGNGDSGVYAFGSPGEMGISISADGNVVAFASDASNLVVGDTNGRKDVFVHDRTTGVTERVSVTSAGAEADRDCTFPALSADGMVVAFSSEASNLVAGDTNGTSDVFVHDRTTGVTERISVDSTGVEGNGWSSGAAISADGSIVAFSSVGSNLVSGDTNGLSDVFVHDRSTGITERVSVDSSGLEGNKISSGAVVSADGGTIVFGSFASNLVAGDANNRWDVFVHDRATGITERVSVDSTGGESNDRSVVGAERSISDDGRIVAFVSRASNLVVGDTNGTYDVFVHDRSSGITERVSLDSNGVQTRDDSKEATVSGDGEIVSYAGLNPANGGEEVYVHDRSRGTTELVSVDSSGQRPNSWCWSPSMSADGQVVVFGSTSSDLVPNDTNGFADVFVHERCVFDASWSNYGQGFAGTNGIPGFVAEANPVRGTTLTLDVESSSGGYGFGLLVVGYQRADIPSGWGGDLLVDPVFSLPIGLSPYGASILSDIPYDDRLCGVVIDLQVLEIDPGAAKGVSSTPGLELVLGR